MVLPQCPGTRRTERVALVVQREAGERADLEHEERVPLKVPERGALVVHRAEEPLENDGDLGCAIQGGSRLLMI